MASPQQEIQQLRRQIADANRTIQENESRNQAALCRTITELQKQYEKARNDQQQDYAARLRRIEESFSNVYIREAERSRQQYQALREKAEAYEQQLSEQIRALQNEQDRLIAEADARNFALRQKAQKALTGLERQIADACALPVDVFFPHCIQHYIEAGEEAKALLQARLYTLALSKADCARLFVTRLTSETQARQNELEALFLLYRQSYEVILQHLHTQGHIYVIYPLSHLAKDLGCCISSVTRAFSELENAQLMERIRSGFSKPSRILLKVPHTTQNCTIAVCKNAEDDCAETSSMIAQKCTPNQRNKSNLKDNHLIKTTDAPLTFGEYRNVFLTEKEYKQLQTDFSGLDSLVEQLSAYIQSTGKKYSDHAATLCIWAKRQKLEQKQTPGIPDYTFKKGESL